jgi:signal transduction histidine kinase
MTAVLPAARPAARRRQRLGVIGWFAVAAGALAAIAVLGLVLNLITLARLSDARAALADRVDPAIAAAYQLDAALVDEETGVRGYLLGHEPAFLDPYRRGHASELRLLAELDRRVADRDLSGSRAHLAAVAARAREWRTGYAVPVIAGVRAGDASPGAARAAEGKARFDRLRASLRELQADLAGARARARTSLSHDATLVTVVVLASGAVLLIALALAGWALRRTVIRPIGTLAGSVRRVARGEYERPVAVGGAREITDLGRDTDAMRVRILDEVRAVEAARAELDRQAQDLQRSNAELEQFAYVASHDLQEPLRKVASFCQMLERRYAGQLDERADQYIHYAVDGARRMQDLINDLLAFSRVGRAEPVREPVALADVLARAEGNLATRIEETGATIEAGELPVVRGDAGLLTIVFQNLVGNAVKFHGDEPPHVRVRADRDESGWEIAVADDGIGIDPEYAERIFVIFQRLHTRVSYDGTGIGLAMCRKIVEHHGGRIWLDTGATPGTTFRFTLPDDDQETVPA